MKRITALIPLPAAGNALAAPFPTGGAQDEQDLGAYLNQHYYKFK